MIKKILYIIIILFLFKGIVFAEDIYFTDKYAWGDETGWVNFRPDGGNVDVTDTKLTGYLWSDNYGWINLQPDTSGVANNKDNGKLSGNAWSEGLGWIDFFGVSIDKDGFFKGQATIENGGTINFIGDNISVRSYWFTNYNPTALALSNDTLIENRPAGTTVGELSTTDPNTTDIFTYTFTCDTKGVDDDNFEIDDNDLNTSFKFDYEKPLDKDEDNKYDICVRVTDKGGKYLDQNFTISITDSLLDNNVPKCKDHSVTGFAWSDTIGWISFDCRTADLDVDYGVDIDRDGYLSGFAWSDAVGWIDFGYYGEDDTPFYNRSNKKLTGKIKVLSGLGDLTDNWNGKIMLNGKTTDGHEYSPIYDDSEHEFDDFAWGSDIVGWVDFKVEHEGETMGVVKMDSFLVKLYANRGTNANPVPYDQDVVLSWTTDGASSCVASNGDGTTWTDNPNKGIGNPNTESETIDHLTTNTLFTLTCDGTDGTTVIRNIEIRVAPANPILTLYVDDDNIEYNTSTTLRWNSEHVNNCQLTSSNGIDENVDALNSYNTGNLTDSTNWFKIHCDSDNPEYYPDGIEQTIYVDVEKLRLEFYPEKNPIKFNDKIKLYWIVEFANSCEASGDLIEFNGARDYDEGSHNWTSSQQNVDKGTEYKIKMTCKGNNSQELERVLKVRVSKNPIYQEI